MTTGLEAGHLSERSLDLLLLDDRAPSSNESKQAHEHLSSCPACRAQLDSLRRSAEYFRLQVHPRTERRVVQALERQAGPAPGRRRWELTALGVAAATAALVLVGRASLQRPPAPDRDLRAKGPASLVVFRQHAGAVSVLSDGAHVQPGDGLRITADPAGHRWLMVASIDGAGHATIYLPYAGLTSAPIDPDHRFEDDGSITLDSTRGPERIFALFSDRPIQATDALRALAQIGGQGAGAIRSTRRLAIAAPFQTSLLLEK